MESEKYKWAWMTKDTLLYDDCCELLYVYAYNDSSNPATVTIYDGDNTHGDIVVVVYQPATGSEHFSPKEPVYCRSGLYVVLSSEVDGCFVQWRNKSRSVEE